MLWHFKWSASHRRLRALGRLSSWRVLYAGLNEWKEFFLVLCQMLMQYKVIILTWESRLYHPFFFISSSYDYTSFVHVDNIYLNYHVDVVDVILRYNCRVTERNQRDSLLHLLWTVIKLVSLPPRLASSSLYWYPCLSYWIRCVSTNNKKVLR